MDPKETAKQLRDMADKLDPPASKRVFGTSEADSVWGGIHDFDKAKFLREINSDRECQARLISAIAGACGFTRFKFDGVLCERTGIGADWQKVVK